MIGRRSCRKPAQVFLVLALISCWNTDSNKSEANDDQKSATAQSKPIHLDNDRTKSERLATGFALREGVLVHADSSTDAAAIGTLNLADHILVLGSESDNENQLPSSIWVSVKTYAEKRGWVEKGSLFILEGWNSQSSPKDLFYGVLLDFVKETPARMRSFALHTTPKRQYLALVLNLADRLERLRTSGDTLPAFFDWEEGDSYFKVKSPVLLPYARARAYLAQGEVASWLEQMQDIMQSHSGHSLFLNEAGPATALEVADTYLFDLLDTSNAVAQYHFVINHFPHMGYDRNCGSPYSFAWKAEGAAWAIRKLFENDGVRLQQESERIIHETPYTEIKLLGYAGLIRSLGLLGRFEQMIDTLMAVLAIHPSVKYPGISESVQQYLSECLSVNYSGDLLSAGIAVLSEKCEITLFAQLAERVVAQFGRYEIGELAALWRAEHADKTNTGLAEVIALYRRVAEMAIARSPGDRWAAQQDFAASKTGQRLRYLSDVSPSETRLLMPLTEMRLGYDKQFPVVRQLSGDMCVKYLYSEPWPEYAEEYQFQWAKVELPDGMIGWMPLNHLQVVHE